MSSYDRTYCRSIDHSDRGAILRAKAESGVYLAHIWGTDHHLALRNAQRHLEMAKGLLERAEKRGDLVKVATALEIYQSAARSLWVAQINQLAS